MSVFLLNKRHDTDSEPLTILNREHVALLLERERGRERGRERAVGTHTLLLQSLQPRTHWQSRCLQRVVQHSCLGFLNSSVKVWPREKGESWENKARFWSFSDCVTGGQMMETKLWIALCALLLTNLGSTEEGDDNAAPSSASKTAPGGGALPKAADSVPGSSPDPINHAATMPSPNGSDTNPSSRGTNSSSSNTTTEGETISLTHEPKKDNGTNIVSPSEAAIPVNNKNLPDHLTSQPPIPPSGSHTPTSPIPLTSNTTNATHTAHNAPADTPTTTPLTDISHRAATPLPDSITPSNKPTRPKTHSSTSVPHATTPEPPTPEAATTTTITQSSSTSSISSSQETPNSESPTLTSPQNTSRPDGHPETSGEFHTKSASTAQAKAQADTHSQLNVGGETTMVHESATLDPLLAGLVSAFIITAVIITLLLFLKLRRRDNRPEFRRLQDLPMDDMMEDTPLSMYSY